MDEDIRVRCGRIADRYGGDRRHALAAMQDMQDEFKYVPREGLELLAGRFGCSVGELYALATFYKALSLKPKGEHVVKVCAGTTCHIRGAGSVRDEVARELGIEVGQTTDDGLFTLEEVHCVGACALAPVVLVDDDLYGDVTLERLPGILASYRNEKSAAAGEVGA